mgnify:CR=1 FL=1
MKSVATSIVTGTLIVAVWGGVVSAEVPESLARWMLRTAGSTTPLPELEKADEPQQVQADWMDPYAWQFAAESETLQRLPQLDETPVGEVRFASGAIVLPLPANWHVAEFDGFRHVRLYLTPSELSENENFRAGLWISYHVLSSPPGTSTQLQNILRQRSPAALPYGAKLAAARVSQLDGRLVVEQPFQTASNPVVSGSHWLIAADWGVVEVHTRYSDNHTAKQLTALLDGLHIGQPIRSPRSPSDVNDTGEPLVGAWKSERARFILRADGSVELHHDRPRLQQIEQVKLIRPARQLRGSYQTDGDVLRVRWADGSQLNLHYRATGSELLLTDHHGRVSQLHRLFE